MRLRDHDRVMHIAVVATSEVQSIATFDLTSFINVTLHLNRTTSTPLPTATMATSIATHQLAIAKASLTAQLLRADPTAVPRDAITEFISLVDRALTDCTRTNIQVDNRPLLLP